MGFIGGALVVWGSMPWMEQPGPEGSWTIIAIGVAFGLIDLFGWRS